MADKACEVEHEARNPKPAPASHAAPSANDGYSPVALEIFRWVRIIGVFLVALDVGALTLLLGRLGVPLRWSLPVAIFTGGLTTYKAQFSHLLSPKAFLVHRSPGRHLAMAFVVLVSNAACFWLVATRSFYFYLFARVGVAVIVTWAWGRRVGPKILGDGLSAIEGLGTRPDET